MRFGVPSECASIQALTLFHGDKRVPDTLCLKHKRVMTSLTYSGVCVCVKVRSETT